MTISVGSVSVSVVPDVTKFARELREKLASVATEATVQVNADTSRADASLAATAALADRLDGRNINMDVRVDDHGGLGRLAASSEGAAGGMGGLMTTVLALSPALIPIGAAAVVGLGGIATAAAAGAAGLGVLALGFSGVLGAVKAIGAAHASAAADAARSAQQQVAAAAQIANAQDGVRNAHRAVEDAVRAAAAGVQSALVQENSAEQAYATAQKAARQATLDLTAARVDAKRALEDLAQQVSDGALTQRQANLAVKQAQLDLNKVLADPTATLLQRQQAKLAYDQAVQQVADVTLRNKRLNEQKAAADKAGVEGSKQVVAAQGRVATTAQAVVDAQAAQTRAAAAVVEAHRAGAERIMVAQEQVISAQRALNTALATTGPTASAASKKAAEALAALTPAGRTFTLFLTNELLPKLKTIREAAQTGLLPGVEAALKSLEPILPPIGKFVGELAKVMGDLFEQAAKALGSPFWRSFGDYVEKTAGPALKTFAGIMGNIVTGIAGLLQAFAPVSDAMGSGLRELTGRFAAFGQSLATNQGFQSFLAYVSDNAPVVVRVLGDILSIFGKLIEVLAPFGAVMLQALAALGDFLSQLDPRVILAIGGAIALAFTGLGAALTSPIALLAELGLAVFYAYQHFQPFHDFIQVKVLPILTALADYITGTVVPILKRIADDAIAGVVIAFHTVSDAVQKHRAELTQLVHAFAAVEKFIVEHILPLLGPVLKGYFVTLGVEVAALIAVISGIVDTFDQVKGAIGGVTTKISDLFDWYKGLNEKFKAVGFSGAFDGLKNAFKDVINYLIDAWNGLDFSIGIPKSVFGIPIPGGGHSIDIGTPDMPRLALGGPVVGPGTAVSDSIPAWLSNGEHVWAAAEVAAIGGHRVLEQLRRSALRGFADGGPVIGTGSGYLQDLSRASYVGGTSGAGMHVDTLEYHAHEVLPQTHTETAAKAMQRLAWTLRQ